MEDLILIGGGGHCKSCIDVIEHTGLYRIVGILDRPEMVGMQVSGYPVIGTDDEISAYISRDCSFLVTVGQIQSGENRATIFNKLIENGAKIPSITSPKSHISRSARIGMGTIVMHNCFVNAESRIGNNCIINTASCIEHDAVIGDSVHISTSAVVNGNCDIGDGVFIGSNAVISHQRRVADHVIVGAGAVVIRDIERQGIYAGNPAREIIK
ncbi:acetyltransferase [Pedobacter deserti]|uniref:acetyltransferase n=1 Tax=Pedobacter deserti TaxID=2817382 RepID=UPI00210C54A8|nr:acetyltransferase [Pedobacter sp. SYSU D00382]